MTPLQGLIGCFIIDGRCQAGRGAGPIKVGEGGVKRFKGEPGVPTEARPAAAVGPG